MSHRRESGAIPPWVVVEPKVTSPSPKNQNGKLVNCDEQDKNDGKRHQEIVSRNEHNLASGDQTYVHEIDPVSCLYVTLNYTIFHWARWHVQLILP